MGLHRRRQRRIYDPKGGYLAGGDAIEVAEAERRELEEFLDRPRVKSPAAGSEKGTIP
jgi:hypothetical protein